MTVVVKYVKGLKKLKRLFEGQISDSQNAKMPKKQPYDANLSFTKSEQGV